MIVLISDAAPPQVNGVVTTITNTIRHVRQRGLAVTLIAPDEFVTIRCPLYREIDIAIAPGRRMKRRLTALLEQHPLLCVHIFTEGPLGVAARNFLVKRRLRFTTSYHTDFPRYAEKYLGIPPALTWRALRWFHNRASSVLVSTPAVQQALARRGFARLSQWGRGVDHDVFVEGAPASPPYFLYAGRVAREKGVEEFLRLDLPGRKVVAGDGPHLSVLRRQFPEALYLGRQAPAEMARVMGEAAVLVFPSRTDTFGIVMAEANACGTPVAAFPVRGPIDVVRPGVTGALSEDLAHAVGQCLALDRQRVAADARERFSWQRCTQQFLDNLCEAQPAAAAARVSPARSARAAHRSRQQFLRQSSSAP